MINVNLTDSIIIIENDQAKLDLAIRIGMSEACEAIFKYFMPDEDNISIITDFINIKKGDNTKRAAHIVCNFLIPPPNTSILSTYIFAVDKILDDGSRAILTKQEVSALVFYSREKMDRWREKRGFLNVLRHSIRVLLLSLLRQDAVLLPSKPGKYLPISATDTLIGCDYIPERVRDICALHYEGLDKGVDWSLCTYKHNNHTEMVKGITALARTGRSQLIGLAMCTKWSSIEELDMDGVIQLDQLVNKGTLGIYLTYFFLKALDKTYAIKMVFPWVDTIKHLRIYVEEYECYASRHKSRRSDTKRARPKESVDRLDLHERICDVVSEATKDGILNVTSLARLIGSLKNRTSVNPSTWPEKSLLPESVPFDCGKQTEHWKKAFQQFGKMKKYADKRSLNPLVPFVFYLVVYLPLYFHLNPDSDAKYPLRVEHLNGYHFISRFEDTTEKLPMPYVEFVREYFRDKDESRVYEGICDLRKFFETILGRRHSLQIPDNFDNPVLNTDVPGSGGRPGKTVKTRLPSRVYWLSLLLSYKIYDYISKINEKCLEDRQFAQNLSIAVNFGSDDNEYLFDIRNIKGINFDTKITLEDIEYEVYMVPRYFFRQVEMPIKGTHDMYLIRPHSIVHNIVALETGIRHQHIQWFSLDYDKYMIVDDIINEEVYRLFVKTDKSNKSWTAFTAGRVMKVLKELKNFRNIIDSKGFDEKVYYENRVENAVYSPFQTLFAFNFKSGNPYSNSVYENGFDNILIGLQPILDHYEVNYSLYKFVETVDGIKYKINNNITPHSTRATVVSENIQYLGSVYVGRYLTNQKEPTVWYYTKFDADQLRNMEKKHKQVLSTLSRDGSKVTLLNGGKLIDATDKNRVLARAFKEDPAQAIIDFGAVSTHFFDRETGISILTSNRKINLSFEPTFICPFNRICPADRRAKKMSNRCNFCDYAIRTVDHLPALSALSRTLLEEIDYIETFCKSHKKIITEAQELDYEARRNIIGEDLSSIQFTIGILRVNHNRLKQEIDDDSVFHVYQPESVLMKLEAVPFPAMNDETKYLLARIKEVKVYPDLNQQAIKLKFSFLKKKILANTGNIRAALTCGDGIDTVTADIYSIVNNLARAYNKTLDDVAKIADMDFDYLLTANGEPVLNLFLE